MVLRSMNSVDSFIGRRMRQFRWVRGISQSDLARLLSVEPEQITAYESGTARIAAAQLVQISDALGVPVTAFFEGIGGSPESAETGSQKVLTAREDQMLSHFKRMSDRQQDAVLSMAQSMAEKLRNTSRPSVDSNVFWPGKASEG